MVVKVAIDLALDRLFTYAVPEALEKELAVGQLLSVPFGRREARGFAMSVAEKMSESAAYELKPVEAIVDTVPFFTPALLKLVRKIADYTAAPIESVLRAALPASVLRKNARARELLYVEPVVAMDVAKLTTRQKWLYDQLVRLGGGWMQQLCRELKTTPASLRLLGTLGFATIEPKARRRDPLAGRRFLPSKPLPLNVEQSAALAAIRARQGRVILLQGVTGSGKTEVYLQAIAEELAAGRGAIVLVPEIALTPQTVQRFASRFGDRVAVLHSALSDGERYDEWHRIRSGVARVVVGPRSAVFAPVKDLGLIVVDEEHETSYKQEDNPRYHARDVAVLRGWIEGATVVLGSATPSLESWMNASVGKYRCVRLTRRAGLGSMPAVHLVNMRERGDEGRIFSQDLLEAIRIRLDRSEQTILFLNRRGYSRSVTCNACGYVMTCPDCGMPYTYHRTDGCLRCHICGGWVLPPKACPQCGAPDFAYKGIGTQRAEAALAVCFPRARILRMDADSTSRKNSHDDILSSFRRGEADVLLGTQMIAKGLDFPNVTLVGVLNADSSLNMPDFRAAERTFQLIAQVAGRAGRAELPGEVFVQSYDPSAAAIRLAAEGDFRRFAETELAERKDAYFPPYCHLATVNLRSKKPGIVSAWADMYARSLEAYARTLPETVAMRVSEAVPSALEKAEGWYRWQVIVRAKASASIVAAWKWLMRVRPAPDELRVALDVDAYNLV